MFHHKNVVFVQSWGCPCLASVLTQQIMMTRGTPVSVHPSRHSPYIGLPAWNFPANSTTPPARWEGTERRGDQNKLQLRQHDTWWLVFKAHIDHAAHTSRVCKLEVVGDALICKECPADTEWGPVRHNGQNTIQYMHVSALLLPAVLHLIHLIFPFCLFLRLDCKNMYYNPSKLWVSPPIYISIFKQLTIN